MAPESSTLKAGTGAKDALIEKMRDRTARIGIIGLGYVGLPLMLRYSEVGYQVIGFDVDERKVSLLNAGKSYIERIAAENKRLRAEPDSKRRLIFHAAAKPMRSSSACRRRSANIASPT